MNLHEESARNLVVSVALYELECGDPTGQKYWPGVGVERPYPKHWCGAFALWCLRQAGLCTWSWSIGKGFAFRLHTTKTPEPGDIAYYSRKQHHAIVERVEGDTVHTVDGNQPGIKTRARPLKAAAAYYSIRSLIAETEPKPETREGPNV